MFSCTKRCQILNHSDSIELAMTEGMSMAAYTGLLMRAEAAVSCFPVDCNWVAKSKVAHIAQHRNSLRKFWTDESCCTRTLVINTINLQCVGTVNCVIQRNWVVFNKLTFIMCREPKDVYIRHQHANSLRRHMIEMYELVNVRRRHA